MPQHAQPATNIARHSSKPRKPSTQPPHARKNVKLQYEPNTPQTGEEEIHP